MDNILTVDQIIDRISGKKFSGVMFDKWEKMPVVVEVDGKKETVLKDMRIHDNEKVVDSIKRMKACDVAFEGKFLATSFKDNVAKGKSKLFSREKAEDSAAATKELSAIVDFYTEVFKNNGSAPDGRRLRASDFVSEMREVAGVLKDNFAIGGVLTVMQQSIVWAGLEILPTEPDIHQYFTIPVSLEPGQIVGMPYAQMEAPGGLDYSGRQELLTTNIGDAMDIYASMGQSGIAVHLTYQELAATNYDMLKLHFMVAKNALIQWKNMKAIACLHNFGVVDIDNLDPDSAKLGGSNGFSLENGGVPDMTITQADFEEVKFQGLQRGHDYSVCIISPNGYKALMSTPEMKEYIKEKGLVWYPKMMGATGQVGRANEPLIRKFKTEGSGEFNRITPVIPSGLASHETTFIVSRFVPEFVEGDIVYRNHDLSKEAKKEYYVNELGQPVKCGVDPLTNMYLLDPSKAVMYAEQRPMSFIDKEDDFREYYRAHFKEGYKFEALFKGSAIRVIKNIAIRKEPKFDLMRHIHVSMTEAQGILSKLK